MKILTCILSIMLSASVSAQSWDNFKILGSFIDDEGDELALFIQENNSFFVETFLGAKKKRQRISISKEGVTKFLSRSYERMTDSDKQMYKKDPHMWIKPDEIRNGRFVFHFTRTNKVGFDRLGNIYIIE